MSSGPAPPSSQAVSFLAGPYPADPQPEPRLNQADPDLGLHRSIRCLRNVIHWNLITTFILRNITWFLLQLIDHEVHEGNEVTSGSLRLGGACLAACRFLAYFM